MKKYLKKFYDAGTIAFHYTILYPYTRVESLSRHLFEIYRAIFIDTSCKKKKSDQLCRKVKGDKNVHSRSTNVTIVEQHEKIVYTKIIQPVEF